jgi:hypothetical protein
MRRGVDAQISSPETAKNACRSPTLLAPVLQLQTRSGVVERGCTLSSMHAPSGQRGSNAPKSRKKNGARCPPLDGIGPQSRSLFATRRGVVDIFPQDMPAIFVLEPPGFPHCSRLLLSCKLKFRKLSRGSIAVNSRYSRAMLSRGRRPGKSPDCQPQRAAKSISRSAGTFAQPRVPRADMDKPAVARDE